MRIVRLGLLAVPALALLGGCVIYDPFGLPSLGTSGSAGAPGSSSPGIYGYGTTYGYGAYDPRYGAYDPRFGYRSYRYDPRLGYASGGYPYYYGPGYYPYPRGPYCRDANRDGRCDSRPRNDDPPGAGRGGGSNEGRDGLGRNPIERLRDVGRPASAGAAVRAPVTSAPLQQPSGAAAGAARPPGISQLPRASQRTPVPAQPPRARPEPPADRPPPAARIGREGHGATGAARPAAPARTVER